ncbi:hypothetical protein B0H14DRAFT_3088835 [Mycena olivaceomarginata]|nr:hypothetical protein B0H14DRAFT_3088835 [Mycena olivaceomarginata]
MASQQTGKGKIARSVHVTIVGDGNGMVGLGFGKHEKGEVARVQVHARGRAQHGLGRAVRGPHDLDGGADQVWRDDGDPAAAPRRVRLRCNPYIHRMLTAAGIKDISAKVWGSRNRIAVYEGDAAAAASWPRTARYGRRAWGPGRKSFKGSGLRSKSAIERERGRRLIDLRV